MFVVSCPLQRVVGQEDTTLKRPWQGVTSDDIQPRRCNDLFLKHGNPVEVMSHGRRRRRVDDGEESSRRGAGSAGIVLLLFLVILFLVSCLPRLRFWGLRDFLLLRSAAWKSCHLFFSRLQSFLIVIFTFFFLSLPICASPYSFANLTCLTRSIDKASRYPSAIPNETTRPASMHA